MAYFRANSRGQWGQSALAVGRSLLDLVLPPRCLVSGEIVDQPGLLAPTAWAQLRFIAEPFCVTCGYPFDFEAEKGSQCVGCLKEAPAFITARSVFVYDNISRDIILRFKHGDRLEGAKTLASWLARSGVDMLAAADMIVPVPLHYWRLFRRRYNQAGLLAQRLSKLCGKPCVLDMLVRHRATAVQGHMGFAERHKNVKRAFSVKAKRVALLDGKVIVLVDDVYTSGATIKKCTKVLLRAGAKEVHVLTLARVTRDGVY